jgi:hypothetical protein
MALKEHFLIKAIDTNFIHELFRTADKTLGQSLREPST